MRSQNQKNPQKSVKCRQNESESGCAKKTTNSAEAPTTNEARTTGIIASAAAFRMVGSSPLPIDGHAAPHAMA